MNSELYHLWLTSCVIFTSLLISLHPEFASETFVPIPLLFSFHTSSLNLSCSGFGRLFPFNGYLIFVIVSAHFALSRSLGCDYSTCKQTWAAFNQKAMYPQHQRALKSFACVVVCSRYIDHCSSILHCLGACCGAQIIWQLDLVERANSSAMLSLAESPPQSCLVVDRFPCNFKVLALESNGWGQEFN